MEHTIFLDIETIPAQSPEVFEKYKAAVKAPGNIKKPESIAAWLKENRDSAAREAIAKTSFDPAAGHICTIGWAVDDDDAVAAHASEVAQEREVIEALFGSLTAFHRYTFVGHNVASFDLRFVVCRAIVLGIKIPRCIPRDPKPWDKSVFDTMTAWAGARGTISMDRLCDALGLPGKDGFDGSMVADAWANGEHERIAEYCKADVEKTRAIWQRFAAVDWVA
jgi:predicted PolB exonuclease-like 3'-5' exonuclease